MNYEEKFDLLLRMKEVIRYALQEMANHPEDSIQDIWNETFDEWNVPWKMRNGSYIVDSKE